MPLAAAADAESVETLVAAAAGPSSGLLPQEVGEPNVNLLTDRGATAILDEPSER